MPGGALASGNSVEVQFSNVPFARGEQDVKEAFTAFDQDHGSELRRFDGTDIHTIDLNPGQPGSMAGSFGGYVEFAGDLYFTAYDPEIGYELHRLIGGSESDEPGMAAGLARLLFRMAD